MIALISNTCSVVSCVIGSSGIEAIEFMNCANAGTNPLTSPEAAPSDLPESWLAMPIV